MENHELLGGLLILSSREWHRATVTHWLHTEINSTAGLDCGCVGLQLPGHLSQVHCHTGFRTAAVHKVLKTLHTHFYWAETHREEREKEIHFASFQRPYILTFDGVDLFQGHIVTAGRQTQSESFGVFFRILYQWQQSWMLTVSFVRVD